MTRRDAAEILHPIYETDGDSERLLRVLEVEIASADDPVAKLGGLEKAVQVASRLLERRARGRSATSSAACAKPRVTSRSSRG